MIIANSMRVGIDLKCNTKGVMLHNIPGKKRIFGCGFDFYKELCCITFREKNEFLGAALIFIWRLPKWVLEGVRVKCLSAHSPGLSQGQAMPKSLRDYAKERA
ncbi:hypothetical protein IAD21_00328 [Abditibacteriota bacterium]|nr:hypothetical protein IAD21_00328 [Abditibacteriota bacterium]